MVALIFQDGTITTATLTHRRHDHLGVELWLKLVRAGVGAGDSL